MDLEGAAAEHHKGLHDPEDICQYRYPDEPEGSPVCGKPKDTPRHWPGRGSMGHAYVAPEGYPAPDCPLCHPELEDRR